MLAKTEVDKLRRLVKISLLISTVFLVVSVFSFYYTASSMGLLPVINYPLRPYVAPTTILGFLFLFSSVAFHFHSSKENE